MQLSVNTIRLSAPLESYIRDNSILHTPPSPFWSSSLLEGSKTGHQADQNTLYIAKDKATSYSFHKCFLLCFFVVVFFMSSRNITLQSFCSCFLGINFERFLKRT